METVTARGVVFALAQPGICAALSRETNHRVFLPRAISSKSLKWPGSVELGDANGKGNFQPETAMVKCFGLDDMLRAHLDEMKVDWSKPVISINLGCRAISSLGGKPRDDFPLAMFLRSGGVVLMALYPFSPPSALPSTAFRVKGNQREAQHQAGILSRGNDQPRECSTWTTEKGDRPSGHA
ncbi:DNA-(apurinic or apyrimidinic site) lyase [Sarracenia purpurea var. burkii]